ncbi:exosortase E/protease, VPEID-CTERM system [Microbulbifer sp. SA54]|uniref:exosortase E/protease, VPEID-CTERM system n=1 Tax=Microbulbifer sp. SA54 TaxID=3401577 RepID=UPI003AAA97C7
MHRKVVLQIGLVFLLVSQLMYVSQRFDAYTLVMEGAADGWRVSFGYLGQVAKIAVLFVVLMGLLLKQDLTALWKNIQLEADFRRVGVYLPPQLLSYWLLVQTSITIFDFAGSANQTDPFAFLIWGGALLSSLWCWLLMFAPVRFWLGTLARYRKPVFVAAVISALVWLFSGLASRLWEPLNSLTFSLASSLLGLFDTELVVVAQSEKLLGLGDFVVSVAPACSGYEGIALITAFLALYLYINRSEFRFPRAFALFPMGIAAIWLLNAVRIAVLIAIGYYWSADVAIGGFHSQAGWIAFILTSLGLLWFAGRWRFVMQTGVVETANLVPGAPYPLAPANSEQAVAMLMPLVALLAAVLVTSALSSGFIWFYPVRVIAVLLALIWFWPVLRLFPYRLTPLPVVAGIAVAGIWIAMLFNSGPQADRMFLEHLQSAPMFWSGLWLVFRFFGAVITVPIAEELAFRGYLLCKLNRSPNYTRGSLASSAVAVLVSSLAFGALHGAWVAGTVAGLAYAFVRLRSQHIGDAILAHATTNLIVFLFAALSGQWSLI